MKIILRLTRYFLALFLGPLPTYAETVVFDCDVKKADSWIPDKVIIEYNTENGDAIVHDPLIYHFNEKRPLPARRDFNNAKRTTHHVHMEFEGCKK